MRTRIASISVSAASAGLLAVGLVDKGLAKYKSKVTKEKRR